MDDARFTRFFLVVAPGLIVYERLLDAFCGKLVENGNGSRDFAKSDISQFADLFIPDAYRDAVFAFVRGNVCSKTEIGLKATGNGMIAITNWHLLNEGDVTEDVEEVEALGAPLDPQQVINAVLPLTPGRATGNSLDVLDRRYARGNVLEFLAGLPELMVFNDEAHHIHEFKREGESTEVEWQISENRHSFARLRYVKEDGLPAFYSPDFLVRTADAVYLVETKAQQQTIHPNVQRKRKATLAWCERINGLSAEQRGGAPWHYVLLAEDVVIEWQAKGARLVDLLSYARLRPLANASLQASLL